MNDLMQALQLLYNAARMAPLPAEAHEQIKAAAEKLAQHLAPPPETPPAPPENG